MKRILSLIGLSFCLASLNVQAADDTRAYKDIPLDPKYQDGLTGDWKRVMGGCIDSIRRASPESHLDAYMEQDSLKYAGTEEEGFQLEKCMAQYGFPIVSMHRSELPQ
jgi:hypothetical protein